MGFSFEVRSGLCSEKQLLEIKCERGRSFKRTEKAAHVLTFCVAAGCGAVLDRSEKMQVILINSLTVFSSELSWSC